MHAPRSVRGVTGRPSWSRRPWRHARLRNRTRCPGTTWWCRRGSCPWQERGRTSTISSGFCWAI